MVEVHSSSLGSLSTTGNGTFGDGTLSVHISSFNGLTFSWSSNIGVDSVFVRTSGGGQEYTYSPEAKGDTNLGAGAPITNLTFCYDVDPVATGTPKVTPPPTAMLFGEGESGGLSGLMLALVTIAAAAAGLVTLSARRRLQPVGGSASVGSAWSTQSIRRSGG